MDNIRKQKGFLDGDPLGGTNSTISRKLKALYDSVKDEAIPDRFLDLLEQLDKAESKEGDEGRI